MKKNSYILMLLYLLSLGVCHQLFTAKLLRQEEYSITQPTPSEVILKIAEYADPMTQKFGLGFTSTSIRNISKYARIDRVAARMILKGNYSIPLETVKQLLPQIVDEETVKKEYRKVFLAHLSLLFNSEAFFKNILFNPSLPLAIQSHLLMKNISKILRDTFTESNLEDPVKDSLKKQKIFSLHLSFDQDQKMLPSILDQFQFSKKIQTKILTLPDTLKQKDYYRNIELLRNLRESMPSYSSIQQIEEIYKRIIDLEQYGIMFKESKTVIKESWSYHTKDIVYSENIMPEIKNISITFPLSVSSREKQAATFLLVTPIKTLDYEKLLAYAEEYEKQEPGVRIKIIFASNWNDFDEQNFKPLVNISNTKENKYNITDKNNTPLLSEALRRKKTFLIQTLMEHDAWWNTNQEGNNPLHFAGTSFSETDEVSEPFLEIFELVLQKSIELPIINKKNNDGKTSLIIAIENNFPGIAQLFLNYDADPNIADNDDNTPLIIACDNRNINIVEELLKPHGKHNLRANPNQKNNAGESPLSIAWNKEDPELTAVLLANDAEPDEPRLNNNNDTLLLSACKERKLEWIELLVKHGANKDHKNNQGESPLSIAEKSQDQKLWLALTRY
jgi:ankyrin repeat protein